MNTYKTNRKYWLLTTDQKVPGLNPGGVTRKSATYSVIVSGFFLAYQTTYQTNLIYSLNNLSP